MQLLSRGGSGTVQASSDETERRTVGRVYPCQLILCSFYSDGAMRVLNEDWGGLMDIMPTMSKALWVCVGISILLNSVSLFREK